MFCSISSQNKINAFARSLYVFIVIFWRKIRLRPNMNISAKKKTKTEKTIVQ